MNERATRRNRFAVALNCAKRRRTPRRCAISRDEDARVSTGGRTGGGDRGEGGRVGRGNLSYPTARVPECPRMSRNGPLLCRNAKRTQSRCRGTGFQSVRAAWDREHGLETRATHASLAFGNVQECSGLFSAREKRKTNPPSLVGFRTG